MKTAIVNRCLTGTAIFFLSAFGLKAQVSADFSANVTSGCAPLRVEFTNLSSNAVEWDWYFGDGSPVEYAEHPVHYYTAPGTYTVTLKAYGGGASDTETKVAYITVTGFEVEAQGTGSTCGLSDGNLDVTVMGGTAPVTYAWSNGATTEDLANISAGTYRVTITDGSGCQIAETYLIENVNHLILTAVKTHVSTPGGSDGTINLTVTGGTGPYSFSWNNGAATEDLSGLPAGNYCVLVTDANGCPEDGCFRIEQPSLCGGFEVAAHVEHAHCGAGNGGIDLTVTGGTPPYTYRWSNGATSQDLTGLVSGSYRVTVEDAGGCRYTETYLVESSGNIRITGYTGPVVSGVHLGFIELTVTGGTQPYSYHWSNGETGRVVDGLQAGTYCVTVTDGSGCSADKCFLIEVAQGGGCSSLAIAGTTHNASSATSDNGYIEVFVSGGTPPYSYAWSNGADGRIIDGLRIGTYCVTVTDASGCVKDKCFVVEAASAGCNLAITAAVTSVSGPGMSNGRIVLTITGGTSPYTYSWSNGATTRNIDGLAPGQYCVVVTDVTGCTRDKCFVVNVAQGGCDGFEVTAQIRGARCGALNGSINLVVSGGTPPYYFVWGSGSHDEDLHHLAAGSYAVTVEDAAGCRFEKTFYVENTSSDLSISSQVTNVSAAGAMDGAINLTVTGGTAPYRYNWTHGDSTQSISGLEAGTYCVLVVDANGCAEDGCFDVEGAGCNDFAITANVGNVPCGASVGYINITVQSGTPPYSFSWSNGATTEDLIGIAAGTYTVTVEDSGSCRKVKTFTVGYSGGFQISGVVTPSAAGAATGSITLSISGAAGPFTFQWTHGATAQAVDNLAPGQYCVLVTAANGCIEDKCFTVGITGGCGDFYVTAWDDIHLCEPGPAWLEANAFYGKQPYSFLWSSGSDDRVTQVQVTVTTTFSVTATDDNGCTATDEVTVYVVNPSASNAGVAFDSITICRGDSVQLAAYGGSDYFWDPGNGLSDRHSATPWASPERTTHYVVRIGNVTCFTTFSVHVTVDQDCVWPGDANSDGIANNHDVLAIGIGFGISGFARPHATSNWEGQYCPDWLLALASGPNLKHVDCDGSGTIDAADTIPLFLNYGRTHNRSGSPGRKFVDPELYFDLPDDTALAGQSVTVPVYLGTSSIQVNNLYGIAFSVGYDNTIVEENTMHFAPVNSFMGNTGELLSFEYDLYHDSKMDVALTRLNRVSVGGFGQIGTISFTMKDDISGKDFLLREVVLSFPAVRAIDNNENDIILYYKDDTMYVKQEASAVPEAGNLTPVMIYPNPAGGTLNIKMPVGNAAEKVLLFDLMGKEVISEHPRGNIVTLDVHRLLAGSYLLKIKSAGREMLRKIVVAR